MLRKWILLTILMVSSAQAYAGFRASIGGGLGSTSSNNEIQKDEGPLVQSFTIEFVQHSKLLLWVEHMRSFNMSPMATSISFTGIFGRYYFNASPTPYASGDDVKPGEIIIRDICYFLGVGTGFTQSSLPTDDDGFTANAAGIYLSPRGGAEMSLTRRLGVRGELMLAMSLIGTGQITSMSLLGSFFYTF